MPEISDWQDERWSPLLLQAAVCQSVTTPICWRTDVVTSGLSIGSSAIAAGAALCGLAYFLAKTGPAADANIGAGLLGLVGLAIAGFGLLVVLANGLANVWRRLRVR